VDDKAPAGVYRGGVPPQYRRFAPLLFIALLLLIALPLLRHSKSSGLSDADRANKTKDALSLMDTGERRLDALHHRYTSHLADLVPGNTQLTRDLAIGLATQLDVSSNGNSYLAQVESSVLSLIEARTGNRVTARSCLILKRSSGVTCATTKT